MTRQAPIAVPARSRGFTLVEVLVAFTILGLLAAAAFSGLRTSLGSWSRGQQSLDELRAAQIGMDLAAEQLREALPFLTELGANPAIAFEGGAGAVRFVSARSTPDGPAASPRWVEFEWDSEEGRLRAAEHRILPPHNEPEAEPYWTGALIRSERLAFRYLRPGQNDEAPVWLEAWESRAEGALPAAVEILHGPDPGRRRVIRLDSAPASRAGGTLR